MRHVEHRSLSVSAYASEISRAVRAVGGATVEGEVQKPKVLRSGMLCFDLADGDSQLCCKVFRQQVGRLEHRPSHGDLVQVDVERPDLWTVAGRAQERVSHAEDLALERVEGRIAGDERELRHVAAILEARDFRRRGYALVAGEDGRAVFSVEGVVPGTRLGLVFRDGRVEAVVEDRNEEFCA